MGGLFSNEKCKECDEPLTKENCISTYNIIEATDLNCKPIFTQSKCQSEYTLTPRTLVGCKTVFTEDVCKDEYDLLENDADICWTEHGTGYKDKCKSQFNVFIDKSDADASNQCWTEYGAGYKDKCKTQFDSLVDFNGDDASERCWTDFKDSYESKCRTHFNLMDKIDFNDPNWSSNKDTCKTIFDENTCKVEYDLIKKDKTQCLTHFPTELVNNTYKPGLKYYVLEGMTEVSDGSEFSTVSSLALQAGDVHTTPIFQRFNISLEQVKRYNNTIISGFFKSPKSGYCSFSGIFDNKGSIWLNYNKVFSATDNWDSTEIPSSETRSLLVKDRYYPFHVFVADSNIQVRVTLCIVAYKFDNDLPVILDTQNSENILFHNGI